MDPRLGLTSATALVVANMIGTGVFSTSGFLLADLGSPGYVLAAWAVGGVQALLGAICYGALARRIPESGGEYCFLSRALHPAAGFIAGWISLLVGFSAPLAAAAHAFGTYAGPWLGGVSPAASGSALILVFALMHGIEVRRGAQVQDGAVLLKVLLILAFILTAVAALAPRSPDVVAPFSLPAFGVSLVWISFSYSGWNAAVYMSGEIRDAERTVPRSLMLGTLLVTLLYIALNAVFVFAAPVKELAGRLEVGRIAARAVGGVFLEEAVAALVALVLISSVSSLVMAGPRVVAKMADDGYLPPWLAMTDGPPRTAIALQSALALLMLWTASFDMLLTTIGFTLGVSTAATVVALLALRRREGAAVRIPGYPVVPGVFLIGVVAMTLFSVMQRPLESLVGVAAMAAGGGAWLLSRRRVAPAVH